MKQIFALILSLSFLVVVNASTNNNAAATFTHHASVIANNTVCKNNDHKVFAHTNSNAHQQPVGKTKVSKSSLNVFLQGNISIPSLTSTGIDETIFSTYENANPSQKLYVLHCSYLL